jgi:hypothetical protein
MFQYSFGLALRARDYEVQFDRSALIEGTHREYSLEAFNTDITFGTPTGPIVYESSHRYNESMLVPVDPSTIIGYFQTERYLAGIEDEVRQTFTLRKPLSGHASRLRLEIETSNSVFLHVRRQDYVGLQHFHGMPTMEYYKAAVERIQDLIPDARIFVFSDDREYCRLNFPEYTVVEGTNKYEDLTLMKSCRHAVLANSSFSWWGCFLGDDQPDRICIAPRRWFTTNIDEEIARNRWIKL